MATFSESKVATNSTDANFRAWGKSISDGLTSVGIIKTADTGQIDWATVTAPGASTVGGYEIRQLNDALQSTSPYYFKIEYGTGSTVNNPQIWITVGHATNGSGTLSLGTGQGSVVRHTIFASAGVTASASSYDINVSGSSSRFGVCLWRNYTNQTGFIGFERGKDNTGADTDEYGTLLTCGGTANTSVKQYTLPKNGTSLASPGTEAIWLMVGTSLSSSSFNNKKGLSEIKPFVGKYGNPMTIAAGVKKADWLTDGEVFTATMYGSSRTFMILHNAYYSSFSSYHPTGMTMRWD